LALWLAACGTDNREITIRTEGMRFISDEVRVKAGQPVSLRVVNQDGYAHAFDIDEFDIHAPLPAQATFAAVFSPTTPGRYRFYCGSPGHEAAGMAGVLVVEP
jgi:plastocyanin